MRGPRASGDPGESRAPEGGRPHLLLFGWYSEATGFTRVLRAVVPHLARYFRITWRGVGYRAPARTLMPHVTLQPTNLRGGDMVGAYAARLGWQMLGADAVLALNDVWYLEHYSRELAEVLGPIPMLGYLPLDGDIPDPRLVEKLAGFHSFYTYTEHAAAELRAALRACGKLTPVAVAGHGVDLDVFAAAADIREAHFDPHVRMCRAQALFGLPEPTWVVLNASRPDPRKRVDLTIDGFARFARGLPPNVRLCLHQAIAHPQFVDPLRRQADALGISSRILWSPADAAPLDDAALCALYNACAVGVNTSVGEGFGLVSFEHAATGAPQLVPDLPALRELWGNAAVRVGPVRRTITPHSPLVMGEVEPEQVAGALAALYRDEAAYRRVARAGHERCQAPDLRWQRPADALLRGLLDALPGRSTPAC
jgi:glycosyltransferase involved in cell wall biosynthesis